MATPSRAVDARQRSRFSSPDGVKCLTPLRVEKVSAHGASFISRNWATVRAGAFTKQRRARQPTSLQSLGLSAREAESRPARSAEPPTSRSVKRCTFRRRPSRGTWRTSTQAGCQGRGELALSCTTSSIDNFFEAPRVPPRPSVPESRSAMGPNGVLRGAVSAEDWALED